MRLQQTTRQYPSKEHFTEYWKHSKTACQHSAQHLKQLRHNLNQKQAEKHQMSPAAENTSLPEVQQSAVSPVHDALQDGGERCDADTGPDQNRML